MPDLDEEPDEKLDDRFDVDGVCLVDADGVCRVEADGDCRFAVEGDCRFETEGDRLPPALFIPPLLFDILFDTEGRLEK